MSRDFEQPVGTVFAYFDDLENFESLFGARATRLSEGEDGNLNGVGSVRRLKVGPAPSFEETITAYVPGELIEYRITRGSPLKDHLGVLRFTPVEAGSNLEWTIAFSAVVPGLDRVIAEVLRRRIARGLAQADPGASN